MPIRIEFRHISSIEHLKLCLLVLLLDDVQEQSRFIVLDLCRHFLGLEFTWFLTVLHVYRRIMRFSQLFVKQLLHITLRLNLHILKLLQFLNFPKSH